MTSKISYLFMKGDAYYKNKRAEILQYVPEKVKKTLEFGTEFGNFSELIKNNFNAEYWGVEIEAKAAQIASKKLYKVLNCDAIDALEILPDDYFDCIIFNDVLEHLLDTFYLLEYLKSKLTSEGVVVVSIPNIRFWNNLRDLVWHGEWDYKEAGILDISHLRFFTYKSLTKTFKKLGYEILKIEGLHPTHSTKFRILNFLLLNKLWDVKYHQFVCVIKPVFR